MINTHLHFDHCGGNRLFPGIPIHVQARELAAARTEPDYTVPEWVDFDGARYVEHDGEAEVLPGIRLLPAPGHTEGHQVVLVDTDDGLVVLGGDVAYTFGELAKGETEGQRRVLELGALTWLAHAERPQVPTPALAELVGGSRRASSSSTLSWIEGTLRRSERNAGAVRTSTWVGSVVLTVAVRGVPVMSAISPRKSPEPQRVDLPAAAADIRRAVDDDHELSPARALLRERRARPAGSISSAISAMWRSSRFVQPAKSGAFEISSAFASLRSIEGFSGAATAQVKSDGIQCPMSRGTDALIVDAVRSPIGKKNGTLSHIRGDDLSAQVVNASSRGTTSIPAQIEDVQWGCVTQVDEQTWNIGRNIALAAGWPVSVCGTTVDRQCGSSMQTNFNAAAAVWSGQLDLVVSGGVEMMSRVPMGSDNGSMSDARVRALRHRDAGDLGRGDREGVEPLARGARPVLATSRTCAPRAHSTRGASRRRSSRSRSTFPRPTTAAAPRR